MSEVERYLKRVTQGLTRQQRAEVRAELESHIFERVQALRLEGVSEEVARAQALKELGPAQVVSRSLRRNGHVHPLLSALALCGLAAVLLSPMPTLFSERWMAGAAPEGVSVTELRAKGAITIGEARQQLRPLGIGLSQQRGRYMLTHAGLPDAELNLISPGMCDKPVYSILPNTPTFPFTRTPRAFYTSMPTLLACMTAAGWPLEIRAGQVFLGTQAFPPLEDQYFASMTREAILTVLYTPAIVASLRQLPQEVGLTNMNLGEPIILPLNLDLQSKAVKLPLSAGKPILVLVKSGNSFQNSIYPFFRTQVMWTDSAGSIRLPVSLMFHGKPGVGPNTSVQLYPSLKAWQAAPLSQNAAMLIALTNRMTDPIKLQPITPQ